MLKSVVIVAILFLVDGLKCRNSGELRPNIVVIMADDLGSHDISLRGSNQIMTPNIDALGYQGVILNRHYTSAMCSPTRGAFLTGKYPIKLGMQYFVIRPGEPRGLPLNEKILPQYLKEAGYSTHIVGKWHQGICQKNMTPTYRGFDSHVGFLGPFIDYYNYTLWIESTGYASGFDFRKNEDVYRNRVGEYATDVIADEASKIILEHDTSGGSLFLFVSQGAPHAANANDPLQTVPEDLETVQHIRDPTRRSYAAMVKALDRSVGTVVRALKRKGILDNTIILFLSDNGGPTVGHHATTASNLPLRGQKDSPWEGGVRGTAVVWTPNLHIRHYVSNDVVHITDWLPTFAHAARVTGYKWEQLDGFNIWDTLQRGSKPLRREVLHNIDPISGYTSYYRDGWKYVNGSTLNGIYDTWLGNRTFEDAPETPYYAKLVMHSEVWRALHPFARKSLGAFEIDVLRREASISCHSQIPSSRECNPLISPCLFNLNADPCEVSNLADGNQGLIESMRNSIKRYELSSVPPSNVPNDPNADPAVNGGLWTWWLDNQATLKA
ncbi:hypothetical protein DMENIID0001_167830 [Sergentomyia squamirostris]